MELEVLISTMHQKDFSLVEKMNIRTNAVFINQTDIEKYEEKLINDNTMKIFSCCERGLSRSRNMAIEKSTADICVVADDDVRYHDNYCQIIQKAYEDNPEADIIAFMVRCTNPGRAKEYKNKEGEMGFVGLLRVGSFEITFKKNSIVSMGVRFNEKYGAGTQYSGVGEENIFLFECKKKGLKPYFVPMEIGIVSHAESTWYVGLNDKYFYHKGIQARELMGKFIGGLFCCYFVIFKYCLYRNEATPLKALKWLFRGLLSNV